MKEILLNVLNSLGYPVYLQGSLNADEAYPETFITFWIDGSIDNAHYNDDCVSVDWDLSVILYSNNPTTVNTKPNEIIAAMKASGFIPQGRGNDIPSDDPTHTGWAMDFKYKQYL